MKNFKKINVLLIILVTIGMGISLGPTVGQNIFNQLKLNEMTGQDRKYGIEGQQAPELANDIEWIDANGKEMEAVKLADHKGKFKVLYGFQSWCPGCHSRGLPALKKMCEALKDNDKVVFFALQTVFEGVHTNTKEKLLETQKKYDLEIPFGHDVGNADQVLCIIIEQAERRGLFLLIRMIKSYSMISIWMLIRQLNI